MTTTPSAWAAVSNDARCNEKSMSWQHLLCAPQGGRPASSCCQASDTRTRVPHPQQPVPLLQFYLSCGCGSVVRGAINCHSNQLATTGGNCRQPMGNQWTINGPADRRPRTTPTQTRLDQDTVLCGLWHMSWLGCCMMATCSRRAIWRNQYCVYVCLCVCLPYWRLSTKGRGTRWRHWQETWAYSIKRNLS